jgi:hypothetical protein
LLPRLAAGLAVLALIAACGSGGASTPRSTGPVDNHSSTSPGPTDASTHGGTGDLADPCTLLHDADITRAGGKAGVHHAVTNDFGSGCNFGVVELYLFDSATRFDSHDGAQSVAGLGDEAWYESDWHRLRVRQADVRFLLRCVLCQHGDLETLPALAGSVLTNLPS